MSTKKRRTLVKALKAVLILTGALLLSPASAHYSLPPLPPELYAPIAPAATTTSFTVSWQSTSGYLCKLSEKVNDGVWASLSNTSSPTNTITLTRAIGKYAYQLTCIGLPGGGSVGPVTSVAVVATIPSLDPLDAQLGYQFQVRTGDIDSDGKKDIYLKRTSGGNANNGVIDKTILTQNNDGHFEVLQDPTSGQFSTAGGWPISASVTAVVNDFNVDGRVDVLLKNLDTVISNVDDQIIFSSGVFFNGAAQVATSIDFEFEKFFRDTYNWILDPNYFSQALVAGLPAYNLAVTFKVWFCINYGLSSSCVTTSRSVYNKTITLAKMGLSGYQTTAAAEAALAASLGFANYDGFRCKLICGWLDFYRFYGSIVFNVVDVWTPTTESPAFDDINFSSKARDISEAAGDIGTGTATIGDVIDIFEEVLGGAADLVLGGEGLGEIIIVDSSHSAEDYEEDKKMTLSLMRIFDAKTDRPGSPKVEIRSRIPLAFLPTALQGNRAHLSVHSPSAVLFSWHSGFPSEGWGTAVGPGGQLLSQEGYLPDARGLTNMLVGYADSFVYSDSFLFWNSLDSAADAYDNDLTYCLFPERSESLFGSCTGYNSNSYATGLIKSRSGNIVPLPGAFGIQHPLTDADRYPGVQKPVPSENF